MLINAVLFLVQPMCPCDCAYKKRLDYWASQGGVLDTTLCDQVCQCLATGRWFFPGTLVSSTNKADHHDVTEILLK
jgi:hypothetical protein